MRIYFSFFNVECNSVLGDPAEILAHLIQFIGNKIACNSIELQPAILPGTNWWPKSLVPTRIGPVVQES